MDSFSLCLDVFCLAGQSVLHLLFSAWLTRKKPKAWHVAAYFFLLCILEGLSVRIAFIGSGAVAVQLLILYGMNRLALGNRRVISGVTAVLALYISQLSFGVINSVQALLFPALVGKPLLYPLLLLATLAAFMLGVCGCIAVGKCLSLTQEDPLPYSGLLLFPGLFFFMVEGYILYTSYSVLPPALSPAESGKHAALLFLQILGWGALLCTLYAYRHIRRSLETQTALLSLTQAAEAQKVYIAEAQMRYEQTKAFRHDIQNHLSVLRGLLDGGKAQEAKAYLQKLETASASLSFPYQTGHPVVDILLSEKLGLAKVQGIAAEASLLLPQPCGIEDVDLCVLFANALDNAVCACQSAQGEKAIRIRGERQGDFYRLEFENTCSPQPLPPRGTGLSNIQRVAEKYHGAMRTEKTDRCFSLQVLLNIS